MYTLYSMYVAGSCLRLGLIPACVRFVDAPQLMGVVFFRYLEVRSLTSHSGHQRRKANFNTVFQFCILRSHAKLPSSFRWLHPSGNYSACTPASYRDYTPVDKQQQIIPMSGRGVENIYIHIRVVGDAGGRVAVGGKGGSLAENMGRSQLRVERDYLMR